MGAHKVTLVMADGSIVDDVIVAWGNQIVSVEGDDDRKINVEDVVDVVDCS